MNGSMRIGIVLVAGLVATGAACQDASRPPVPKASGVAGAAQAATLSGAGPRMRSLRVGDAIPDAEGAPAVAQVDTPPAAGSDSAQPPPVSQTSSGGGNRQTLNLRSTNGRVSLRQDGGGNTQILNAEGSATGVTQRQTGSGNLQWMNIGVTDNPPPVINGGTSRQ
jgi:hypothetical protein